MAELPNKITPEFLKSQIVNVQYARLGGTITHCTITVKNGFTFTGESACVDPDNFDEKIGQEVAYDQAFDKMWMPYGFLLKEQLAQQEKWQSDPCYAVDTCSECKRSYQS